MSPAESPAVDAGISPFRFLLLKCPFPILAFWIKCGLEKGRLSVDGFWKIDFLWANWPESPVGIFEMDVPTHPNLFS